MPALPLPLRVVSDVPARGPARVVPAYGRGFYKQEFGEGLPFRWLSLEGQLEFEPVALPRFLEFQAHSHFQDLSQTLTLESGDSRLTRPLGQHWNVVSFAVPAGATSVTLRVNKVFPREHYPGDGRDLALMTREPSLHEDPARHAHVVRQQDNLVLNRTEMLDRKTVMTSTPTLLGIDVQGSCNVKPPCVYCAWDYSKEREGANVDLPFNARTLAEYGPYFDNSAMLVNCSIGEPFMTKDVDPLLDAIGERGKLLETTTNGQILTEANIARLLGRNVHLYVSLDAATAETYARLRNERWDSVIQNLKRLVAAKGGKGKLPLIYLVFMPMRANAHEADDFVRLVAELGADRLVLRPLNPSEGLDLVFDRAGYHYDYQKELLPFPELVHISGRMRELAKQLDVDLADQLDFGGNLQSLFPAEFEAGRLEAQLKQAVAQAAASPAVAAPVVAVEAPAATPASRPTPVPLKVLSSLGEEKVPLCVEPWTSLYVLRRGTLPCCYGGKAIAPMSQFRDAWNGPTMQAIRGELAKGRFHGYCHDSPDCPIVKKAAEAHALPPRERFLRFAHRTANRWSRKAYGWPGWIYRQVRHRTLNVLGHFKAQRPS